MSTFATSIQYSTWNHSYNNIQLEEIKGIQMGNEKAKISLFAVDMILYINDHKDSTGNLLQ